MREQLLNRMIRIYGFEHEVVIAFAELIESNTFTDEMLETIVKAHEAHPIVEDEKDEQSFFYGGRALSDPQARCSRGRALCTKKGAKVYAF